MQFVAPGSTSRSRARRMPSMSSRARVVTSTPKCFPLIRTVEVGGVLANLELDTGSEELRGDQLGACLQKFRERLMPARAGALASGPPPSCAATQRGRWRNPQVGYVYPVWNPQA